MAEERGQRANQIQENICEAIKLIIDAELQELSYDKTVICTIIDDSKKNEGKYKVSEGSVSYEAYSESTDYKKNDQVLVSIQQGDYSQEKTIIRKYSASDELNKIVPYVSPLETVVTMTENLVERIENNSILANGQISIKNSLWEKNLTEASSHISNNKDYDSLIIKADFKTLLNSKKYDIRTGQYGLKIEIEHIVDEESNDSLIREYVLDSHQDMFGDPYSFQTYLTQEKKINISNLGRIIKIKLKLYQTNNFQYWDNQINTLKLLPNTKTSILGKEEYLPDNIFVNNVQLYFGYDISKLEDNTFKILTNDSNSYETNSNQKQINVLWINKNENNKYLGFSDGIYDPTYDEDEYKDEYNKQMKGVGFTAEELGNNKVPSLIEAMQIYANANDINKHYEIILQRLDEIDYTWNELLEKFQAYSVVKDDYEEIGNKLNTLYEDACRIVQNAYRKKGQEEDEEDSAFYQYLNCLSEYDKIYEKILKEEEVVDKDYPNYIDYYNASKNIYKEVKNNIDKIISFFSDAEGLNYKTLIDKQTSAQVFVLRSLDAFNQIIEYINTELNSIMLIENEDEEDNYSQKNLLKSVEKRLKEKNIDSIQIEYENFVKKYENKYCLYWYIKEPGYLDEKERFMEPGWRRLTEFNNKGLPKKESSLNKGFYPVRDEDNDSINLNLPLDIQTAEIIAVLIYNHSIFKAVDNLVFVNTTPIHDTVTIDKSKALSIEHKDNSQDTFQLYGIDNYLINRSDAMVNRKIRLRFNGEEQKDEFLIDSLVFWYIPKNASMLSFDSKTLIDLGYSNNLGKEFSTYEKEGYDCFYKLIKYYQNENNEIVDVNGQPVKGVKDDTIFIYNIESYYSPTANNNTIYCKVLKDDEIYEVEKSFSFVTFGTSGTQYTLAVTPIGRKVSLENKGDLQLKIALYDYNNNLVQNPPPITAEWHTNTSSQLDISDYNIKDKNITISSQEDLTFYYNVLKVSANLKEAVADNTVKLITYYPVPYSNGNYYIELPSTVYYDEQGKNPTYYKNAFKVYNAETDKEEIEGIKWNLIHYTEEYDNSIGANVFKELDLKTEEGEQLSNYLPRLITNKREPDNENSIIDYFLQPLNLFIDGINCYSVITCEKNNKLIWAQPLIIAQNQYSSELLNSWSGELTIDEENGTILSTMVGAGKKDNENRFSGVLMGDLRVADISTVGLYGFHQGALSFGFKNDGTAFIGKSGAGRIIMDGSRGIIQSAIREKNPLEGTLIDLDDGLIDIRGAYMGSVNKIIRICEKAPYFQIQINNKDLINNNKDLIHIGEENYYLQSINYESNTDGMKIDLNNGLIDSYKFKLNSSGIDLNSSATGDQNYIRIGDPDGNGGITFTGNNKLTIKANSLKLTGSFGGSNLLNNTAPMEEENSKIVESWILKNNNSSLTSVVKGNKKCIKLSGSGENGIKGFSQNLENIYSDDYVLSGQVYCDQAGSIKIKIGDIIQEFNIEASKWQSFRLYYTFESDLESPTIEILDSNINKDTFYYHLQLEKGTVATDWGESASDVQKQYEDYSENGILDYDRQLDQDEIFNKLTDNGKAQGIVIDNGQLYINATYIAASILRSSNWESEITYKLDDKEYRVSSENFHPEQYPSAKIINIEATKGMYINLDSGKIWSKNFELDAWADNQGLYLNNDSNKDYYFRVGNSNSGEISFGTGNDLNITVKNFELNAWTDTDTNSQGLYLNNDPAKGYYFRVGNSDSGEISFSTKNDLSIKINNGNFTANSFNLTAGVVNNSGFIGIYSNDDNADNNKISINEQKGDTDKGIIWRIVAGNNFGVTKDGSLYAANVNVSGTITADSGTLGGWEITEIGDPNDPSITHKLLISSALSHPFQNEDTTKNTIELDSYNGSITVFSEKQTKEFVTKEDEEGNIISEEIRYDQFANQYAFRVDKSGTGQIGNWKYGTRYFTSAAAAKFKPDTNEAQDYPEGSVGLGAYPQGGNKSPAFWISGYGNPYDKSKEEGFFAKWKRSSPFYIDSDGNIVTSKIYSVKREDTEEIISQPYAVTLKLVEMDINGKTVYVFEPTYETVPEKIPVGDILYQWSDGIWRDTEQSETSNT